MGLAWLLLGQPQSTALSAGLAWKLLGQSQLMVQWAELAWQLVQLYLKIILIKKILQRYKKLIFIQIKFGFPYCN